MSRAHPKNPRSPRSDLTLPEECVRGYSGPLWRIHTVVGPYRMAWDELRWHGPLRRSRWDPQPGPLAERSSVGVSYTAPAPTTCFAEVFQDDRAITLTSDLALSGWLPSRELALLDLTGGSGSSDWAVQNGASASLPQALRGTCRAWAQAIHEQLGEQIDGLLAPSTVLGDPVIVLFARAADAFPAAPSFSRTLEQADVLTLAVRVRDRLGWPIR